MLEYYTKIHLIIDAVIGLAAFIWLTAFVVDRAISRAARLVMGREAYYTLLDEICKKLTSNENLH
ncbi:hypothetical protein N836_31570 [Leptolyngbya sp. Heron Island J]|uniref:hypothetical protein n=1 Tax=Leptolyngbya sp. Heron Island J TaxID=1385935 RepID=UPI0003B93F5F|nr:hypothetical protein [Leptolyngbya sp. Heron Island J]ESA38481.1 hypothetical protein N836_31570 [Leptolyngbya sp. Heron Island J]